MDEENQFGGLSQAKPATPALAQANVPTVSPQPVLSPVEVATKAYQDERKKLIDIQNQLLASLEARVGGGPQEMFMAMAQGFGAPTKTGSFGESLGYASKAMGDVIERGQKGQFDIAKLRAELAAQQLGFKKEDIELAKTKQLSDTLVSVLSGQGTPGQLASIGLNSQQASLVSRMPNEYKGMIIAQLQSGDVKGAVQELQKFMFEQTKVPDDIKKLQYFAAQFKSPAARQAAEQLAAVNYFIGNPAERAKTIIDIRRAIDAGEMPASEGNVLIQGMTSIGGMMGGSQPDSTTSSIVRQTMPTEDEARQRMIELNRLGVPASVSVAPSAGAAPAAGVSPAEVEPKPLSGAVVPTASVIQGASGISGRQQREIRALEIQEEIKARAATREQAYKKLEEDVRNSEPLASSAASTINSMKRFLSGSQSASAGGLQPLFTNVKNLLSSLGISSDSLVNEQKMSAAIDQVLLGKMESMGSAARGLTDKDMEMMRNALPRLNTDRKAREEIAKIIMKSKANDIDDYRLRRVNESVNFPLQASVRLAPKFYIDWIKNTEDFTQLQSQTSRAITQKDKDDVMKRFDAYYGIGVARQVLR